MRGVDRRCGMRAVSNRTVLEQLLLIYLLCRDPENRRKRRAAGKFGLGNRFPGAQTAKPFASHVNRCVKASSATFLSQSHRRGPFISALVPAVLCGLCLISALGQTAVNESFANAMQLGSQAMTAGNFAASVEAYTLATHLQPGFAEAYFNLGLGPGTGWPARRCAPGS